jgi:peptide/nickel transport system permease protein
VFSNIFSLSVIRPKLKELKLSFYLLNKNALTRAAFIILILLVLLAILAPWVIPFPDHIFTGNDPANSLRPPSSINLFGTDELGRDIFSRVIYGTRISLQAAIVTVFFAVIIGSTLGAIAGSKGGWIDEIIMRITDIFLSFPPLLLSITIAALMGPSLMNAKIAIVIAWWPWYTRLVRGQAISIKEKQFSKAAETIGTSQATIIFKHIVPNCISPVIIQASMDMGAVILSLAGLSFLGLGAQPPTPEWGLMINTSRNYFMTAPWYSLFPGIAIFITVLSFNLLGDGIREILDPKTRKN